MNTVDRPTISSHLTPAQVNPVASPPAAANLPALVPQSAVAVFPAGNAPWTHVGISLTGLATMGGLVATSNPGLALVVAGVTAAVQLATVALGYRKRAASLPAPALSVATREAIAEGVRKLAADGVHFVGTTENGARFGSSLLPAPMVLSTLVNNGVVYYGPSCVGRQANNVIRSVDGVRIKSVEALAQLVNIDLDAPSTPAVVG
ncbi:MAG: hypothetical protein ACAI38_01570 [Myxococcota bacterium]|nr:hypothetical protein [Myxococcota bacterium]